MAGYAAGFSGLESFSPSPSPRLVSSLSLAIYLPIYSCRLAQRRAEKQERESRARCNERHEGRNEIERQRGKQVVRGSSMRETFDPVEIPLISSVPLRARAYKRNEACATRRKRHE